MRITLPNRGGFGKKRYTVFIVYEPGHNRWPAVCHDARYMLVCKLRVVLWHLFTGKNQGMLERLGTGDTGGAGG